MKCIICRQEKEESDEHIIPEALGNKKLITRRVCKECNNKLGTKVDDYLMNHPIVKLVRTNEKLYGKSGKDIKFFSGFEIDEKTGLKYDMKSGKPILQPRIVSDNDGHIRIEAANVERALYGKVREDVREILNTLCKYKSVEIIAGAVCVDHVHLSVAIPPKISVSDFMGYLKDKSTLMIYDRHPELQSKWEKAF